MDDLIKDGKGVPPYHVSCRGSVHGHFEFNENIEKNYEPLKPTGADPDRKSMYDYWKSLTPYERKHKIELAKTEGILDSFDFRGEDNWKKHKRDLHNIKSIEEMKRESINVLKTPERILLNVDNSIAKRPGLMYNFFKGDKDDWLQVTVDIDGTTRGASQTPIILHAYKHKYSKKKTIDERIKDLVTTNKFIEVKNG